jgi:hypothetical protein
MGRQEGKACLPLDAESAHQTAEANGNEVTVLRTKMPFRTFECLVPGS